MRIPIWQRLTKYLFRLAAVLAELAIGIPGIIIVFSNQWPTRWWVLGLTVIFIGASLAFSRCAEETSRRLIHPYLVLQAAITSVMLLLNPDLNFYVIWFYVLSIEAMMALSRRLGYIWLGIFVLLTVVILGFSLEPVEMLVILPIYLGGFFFFATFANATYNANVARQESQRLLEELQTAHRKLQAYASQAETLAIAEERNRLSREVHDTIGHRLTVAAVQLEGAQRLISTDPQRASEMVVTVREQVRQALGELRQTVATLRDPLEADLPLETSLKRLVSSFEQATNLSIHLLLPDNFPKMSNAHRLALYRTAQEALTNVQKHASANQVWLQLSRQEDILTLRVSDNGQGLAGENGEAGFGLRGIRERAAQLGGEVKLESRPGGGTRVSLRLPLGSGLPVGG